MSPRPTGFGRSYLLPTPDHRCEIGVGFDVRRGVVRRFLVQLQLTPRNAETASQQIARIDHNPCSTFGHDVRAEGVHVDVVLADGGERTVRPPGGTFTHRDLGDLIDHAIEYFRSHCGYFRSVHVGDVDPDEPPRW